MPDPTPVGGPAKTAGDTAGGPPGSPIRSVLAVAAGWIVVMLLGQLLLRVLAATMGADFPTEEGSQPSERGLAIWIAGSVPNGIVAGLITARLAGWAPIAHAAVLAGIIGFFAMSSADQASELPGWFAIAWIVVPALAIALGGVVARYARRARA